MKKIYLTGVPASGKTTLTQQLISLQKNIMALSYSEVLSKYLSEKNGKPLEIQDLRKQSESIITPNDIRMVDNKIKKIIKKYSEKKHIILDAHAVTTEMYGVRTTPFDERTLKEINFDMLVVLYADPQLIISRICEKPSGRRKLCQHEVVNAMSILNSVIINYGLILKRPVYFLDSGKGIDYLADWLLNMINR